MAALELMSALVETNSKIHRQFRNAHEGHRSHAGLDPTRASTGVVWVRYSSIFTENPIMGADMS